MLNQVYIASAMAFEKSSFNRVGQAKLTVFITRYHTTIDEDILQGWRILLVDIIFNLHRILLHQLNRVYPLERNISSSFLKDLFS
jgi:hypothetical protein